MILGENSPAGESDLLISQLWAEAQGAVQSSLDRDVLDEAVGLAEAELADITLALRLQDSIGHWIRVSATGYSEAAQLTAVNLTGEWLCLSSDTLINVRALHRISGLRRLISPTNSVRCPFSEKQWLRDRLGTQVRLFLGGIYIVGELIEVGADYIAIRSPMNSGDRSFGDVIQLEQVTKLESGV